MKRTNMNNYGRRQFLKNSGLAVELAAGLPASSLLRSFAFAAAEKRPMIEAIVEHFTGDFDSYKLAGYRGRLEEIPFDFHELIALFGNWCCPK